MAMMSGNCDFHLVTFGLDNSDLCNICDIHNDLHDCMVSFVSMMSLMWCP
jgi:hypothetical protein